MEVIGIADVVDIDVGRSLYRLATLSALNDFLKLGASRLNLTSSVANILQLFVSIRIDEVIIAGQDRPAFTGVIGALEGLTVFNALIVLLFLLT